MKKSDIKTKAARYLKIVEWSDEDRCFVGRIPGLVAGGIHGDDEAKVYRELCDAAEEWIALIESDGKPLPPPSAGKTYTGKFIVRISPDLHQKAALKAMARNESLNQFVAHAIADA
jgi:predicted HicB family RNase H-like nuclease